MSYDKVIVSLCGEEFPYSDLSDDYSYYYEISICFDERDAVLFISKWGSHIEFDDDGSWLDYKIAPDDFFPNQQQLSHSNILAYMEILLSRESEGKLLTRADVEDSYQRYLKSGR